MTITLDQLKEELQSFAFCRNRNHRDERFGKYIYNQYGIEFGNSYQVEDKFKAYQLIAEGLTRVNPWYKSTSDVIQIGGKSNEGQDRE